MARIGGLPARRVGRQRNVALLSVGLHGYRLLMLSIDLQDLSDSPVVYRIAGAIEVMAGGVGLNLAIRPNHRHGRLLGIAVSSATIGVGCALFARPAPTAARIRRAKEFASAMGLIGSWMGNATAGAPQSPTFFPTVCLAGIGAGMGGRDGWRHYGSLAGAGALLATFLRTDPQVLRMRRMAGWAYVGAPLSYVNAAFVGARVADSSLRIREVTELLTRESERTDSLKKLASTLAELARAGRALNTDIEVWAREVLAARERDRALEEVRDGRETLQAVLDAARAGVATPGDLSSDLAALGEGWRRRGLADRGVEVEVVVAPEVMALASPSVVGQIHLLFSRYLQNVLRKEWTRRVRIEVTVKDGASIAVEVSDDGGGEVPAETGDGLWASRRGFAYSLGGSFQIAADGEHFYVRASAPVDAVPHRSAGGAVEQWAVDEGMTLISDALSSTIQTTAVQDIAIALLDREDAMRWPSLVVAVCQGLLTPRSSSVSRLVPRFALSLLSGATATITREDAWSVDGSMLMTAGAVAWHHGPSPGIALVAAHLAVAGARGRGRRDEVRLAIDAIVPSVTVVGGLLAARRFMTILAERELAVGHALDRADMHLQIHSVLMDHHDLVGAVNIPFGRDSRGKALNERRSEQQAAYNKVKSQFQELLSETDDMHSVLFGAAHARADGVPVEVHVDPLPDPQHARIGREAAAVAQRASMVDLVALAVRRNVEAFPRNILGRRGLAKIVVRLSRGPDDLQLSVTSVPTRRPEDAELDMIASTAAHAGGALDETTTELVSLCFPIP